MTEPIKIAFRFEPKTACDDKGHYFDSTTGKGCFCGFVKFKGADPGLPKPVVIRQVVKTSEMADVEIDWF